MKFYFVLSVIWLLKVQKRITGRKIKFGLTDSARPGKPVLQRYVENELEKDILRDGKRII
jgi:hypothetical protein